MYDYSNDYKAWNYYAARNSFKRICLNKTQCDL